MNAVLIGLLIGIVAYPIYMAIESNHYENKRAKEGMRKLRAKDNGTA